jgi:hypothetical protein
MVSVELTARATKGILQRLNEIMDKAIAAIHPQTFENWIALSGVLAPLMTLAGSGFWREIARRGADKEDIIAA